MKSPFVCCNPFVRTPLTIATVALCAAWGCRHLPSAHHDCHPNDAVVVTQPAPATEAPPTSNYEEATISDPSQVIDPNGVEPPAVAAPPEDAFDLAPAPVKQEPAKPPVKEQPVPATPPPQSPKEKEIEKPKPATNGKLDVPPAPETPAEPKSNSPKPIAPKTQPTESKTAPEATPPQPPHKNSEPSELFDTGDLIGTAKNDAARSRKVKVAAQSVATKRHQSARHTVRSAVSTGTKLNNEIVSVESYCDGLVFDAQGFGYVSSHHQIVRFSPTGEASVWATLSSPKGHGIEPEGTHLVCDLERRAVLRLSYEGKVIAVAAQECNGEPLRAPYDVAVDPRGGFYFTDPGYVQNRTAAGKLHYVDRSGKVSLVAAKIGFPTGIAYDAGQQRVFVAESHFNRILEFRLSEPGKIESLEVFAELPKSPSDEFHLAGLCLDADGNLYVTQMKSKTVHAFDRQGRSIGKFSCGELSPSAVALRGPDAEELFLSGEITSPKRTGKVIRLNLGQTNPPQTIE